MSEERLRKDINRLKQLTNGCIPEFHQDIEDVLDRFEQLKEMFEDSKTYSKQFLYKHNKNLLEANERLSRKNEQLKEKRDLAVQKVNEEREKNVDLEILLDKYKKVIEEVRQLAIKQIDISNKEIDKIKYTNGYNPIYKTLLVGQELDIIKIQEKLLQIFDKVKVDNERPN